MTRFRIMCNRIIDALIRFPLVVLPIVMSYHILMQNCNLYIDNFV